MMQFGYDYEVNTHHLPRTFPRSLMRSGPPRRRRSTARRPPHPGAGRDNHRKILPKEWFYFPNIPYGKGGFDGSGGGGGKLSPGVISLMNPGPYWPLYLWGWLVGGDQRTALCQGGFASRPMVARLVRYGPVRQKKTFHTISQHAPAPPGKIEPNRHARADVRLSVVIVPFPDRNGYSE